MNNTTTTFLKFIQEHYIQIPLIQRDYVQGLGQTDKSKEKRDEFVKKLLDALLPENPPYTLDFIYGARESFDEKIQNPDAHFLPIDGQQRLTTLYLLHWILAVKTNQEGCHNNVLALLKKFSYKTRISSDKFCRRLLDAEFTADKSLYQQIKERTWYVGLEVDPTVFAMMEMIKQIEDMLATEPYKSHQSNMASNLFDNEKSHITFSILDMVKYNLTDGLYVKMNARGKELTPFENWKADFINLISIDEHMKDKFTDRIEHEWNDLFWKDTYNEFATKTRAITDEKERRKIKYPRIDDHFMNFFTNFSRLYFFLYTEADKAEDFNGNVWSTTEKLYGQNDQLIKELFNALDTLVEIDKTNKGVDTFFNNLFHMNLSADWSEYTEKVKLFECDNINLFKKCYEDDNFGWQHILLYAILKYCAKHKVYQVTEELKIYVRICRNYLYQHNYLDAGKVTIVAQIRITDIKTYENAFSFLCSDKNPIKAFSQKMKGEDAKYLEIEGEKTIYYNCHNKDIIKLVHKIEDMAICHGNIDAFKEVINNCIKGSLSCEEVWQAILSFHQASSLQKAQLFVAFDYKGIIIGNDCAYGKRVFIGGESKWEVHFRKNEEKLGEWISKYINAYIKNPSVENLITTKQEEIKDNPTTMRDYMLKYKEVIAAKLRSPAPFYYAMPKPWQDMDAIVIHSFSSRPLGNSYQTCPMANAVARETSNFDSKYMDFTGRGSSKEGINIHNGDWSKLYLSMRFDKFEWHVTAESHPNLSPDLQAKLIPVSAADGKISHYLLSSTPDCDLIENAVKFIEEAAKLFIPQNKQ